MFKKIILAVVSLVFLFIIASKAYIFFEVRQFSKYLPSKIENFELSSKNMGESSLTKNKLLEVVYLPIGKNNEIRRIIINLVKMDSDKDFGTALAGLSRMDKNSANIVNTKETFNNYKIKHVDVYSTYNQLAKSSHVLFMQGDYYYDIVLNYDFVGRNSNDDVIEEYLNAVSNKIADSVIK